MALQYVLLGHILEYLSIKRHFQPENVCLELEQKFLEPFKNALKDACYKDHQMCCSQRNSEWQVEKLIQVSEGDIIPPCDYNSHKINRADHISQFKIQSVTFHIKLTFKKWNHNSHGIQCFYHNSQTIQRSYFTLSKLYN